MPGTCGYPLLVRPLGLPYVPIGPKGPQNLWARAVPGVNAWASQKTFTATLLAQAFTAATAGRNMGTDGVPSAQSSHKEVWLSFQWCCWRAARRWTTMTPRARLLSDGMWS